MPHGALVHAYLCLLGLASGLVVLAMSAYRRVSPVWLRWMLIACGGLMVCRYLTLALYTTPDAPQRFWFLRHWWFASSIGLALPTVFAVDQLVKHPAMTPEKLLRWMMPWLAVWLAVMFLGRYTAIQDASVGWTLSLSAGWRWLAAGVQAIYVIGVIAMCIMLAKKLPSRPIRLALLGLIAGHLSLGADGLLVALGGSYFRPFLFSEMATLLAIWYAYETGTSLQQSG